MCEINVLQGIATPSIHALLQFAMAYIIGSVPTQPITYTTHEELGADVESIESGPPILQVDTSFSLSSGASPWRKLPPLQPAAPKFPRVGDFVTWPPVLTRSKVTPQGFGLCVSTALDVVAVSTDDNTIVVSRLSTGQRLRVIGGEGYNQGQLDYSMGAGRMCMTHRGTILVAEFDNNRVQELDVNTGGHVRFIGTGVVCEPQCVDCNRQLIAVCDDRFRITLLSWRSGALLRRMGRGHLSGPLGLRLLRDGVSLAVADTNHHRICVFSTDGALLYSVGSRDLGLNLPNDVVEDGSGGFVVCNRGKHNLVRLTAAPVVIVDDFGTRAFKGRTFQDPVAITTLPEGGLVVRGVTSLHVLRGLQIRVGWVTAVAVFVTHFNRLPRRRRRLAVYERLVQASTTGSKVNKSIS
jgi:hypothetical protein